MTLAEFLNTKLFGSIFSIICIGSLMYVSFTAGKSSGFREGYKTGLTENPTPHVVTVTEYVFDDKRIARIDPRDSNTLVLIDMEKKTISRIPLNENLEKQEVGKFDTEN